VRRRLSSQHGPGFVELVFAGRAERPVIAHLGEAARQDVLEEALDELLGRQDAALGLARLGVLIAEGHLAVPEAVV